MMKEILVEKLTIADIISSKKLPHFSESKTHQCLQRTLILKTKFLKKETVIVFERF